MQPTGSHAQLLKRASKDVFILILKTSGPAMITSLGASPQGCDRVGCQGRPSLRGVQASGEPAATPRPCCAGRSRHGPHAGPGPRSERHPRSAHETPPHREALSLPLTRRNLIARKRSDSPQLPGAPLPGAAPQAVPEGQRGVRDCGDCPRTLTERRHSCAVHQWDPRRWHQPRNYSGQAHALNLARGPACQPGPSLPSLGH